MAIYGDLSSNIMIVSSSETQGKIVWARKNLNYPGCQRLFMGDFRFRASLKKLSSLHARKNLWYGRVSLNGRGKK